ncbi:calmodulin-binding transcription activator 4-like [Gossypium raimondii]|uniref:calmodulin-binding transcription activator 4-like n=1 Tax=Gossypium raimondii TaxID=29730 RepID=UPI00227C17CB|nr:calmodulin-binding transcription activator 4-like [Gossypium raimondii]XP_052479272.1 calmodulin-binding transcription activator 4-like [Gossypium raimondii]
MQFPGFYVMDLDLKTCWKKPSHEHLKVGDKERIHVYYAHGEDNSTFIRRCYWLLDKSLEQIVLLHYRETKEFGVYYKQKTLRYHSRIKQSFMFLPTQNQFVNDVCGFVLQTIAGFTSHTFKFEFVNRSVYSFACYRRV